jgi:hypothetical protein
MRCAFVTTARTHRGLASGDDDGGGGDDAAEGGGDRWGRPREISRGALRSVRAALHRALAEEVRRALEVFDVLGNDRVGVGVVRARVRPRGGVVAREAHDPARVQRPEARAREHGHAAVHAHGEEVVLGPRGRARVPALDLPEHARAGRHRAERRRRPDERPATTRREK